MKSYKLKRKKWYSSSFLIYCGEQLVGELEHKELNNLYSVTINNRVFSAQTKNIFKEQKHFFEGNNQIGILNPFAFKNYANLNIDKFGPVKLSRNIWKASYSLELNGKTLAECKTSLKGITVTTSDSLDESLLAAMIVQAISYENSEASIAIFIPLFIILFM